MNLEIIIRGLRKDYERFPLRSYPLSTKELIAGPLINFAILKLGYFPPSNRLH